MARFKLTFGRGDDGKPSILEFNAEVPEVGVVQVTRRTEGKVDVSWEGPDATVESVIKFIRGKYGDLGDMFPGLKD